MTLPLESGKVSKIGSFVPRFPKNMTSKSFDACAEMTRMASMGMARLDVSNKPSASKIKAFSFFASLASCHR